MGFDIGGALSGIWNATVGTAVRAVQQIFDPPEPPAAAPTMAKDESILRHTADWEVRAKLEPPSEIIGDKGGSIISNNGVNIIGNNGSNIISNNGVNIIGNNGSNIISENGASFQVADQAGGGVLVLTPDGKSESHDIVINRPDGSRTSIDNGVVKTDGSGNHTVGDSIRYDGQGNTTVINERSMPSTTPRTP